MFFLNQLQYLKIFPEHKKLFWIVFCILSCCEFAQVAYSKNIPATNQDIKVSGLDMQSQNEKATIAQQVFKGKSASYLLPR